MLALVAGEGDLPKLVMETLDARETAFRLCEIDGYSSIYRGDRPVIRFRIETLGSFIAELVEAGVTQICFAGGVARPPLDPSKVDQTTMPLVPRMIAALQQGDDSALRTLLQFFKEAGIDSLGAHDIRPDLLPAPGIMGRKQPSNQHKTDTQRGIDIIGAMAKVDVGQACIVAQGQALAIEATPGTDWMMLTLLEQNADVKSELIASVLGTGTPATRSDRFPKGGVLVKAAKPGQDLRIDMPSIGPGTFRRAAQVRLEGIVIEAGRVMVLDLPRCIEIADQHGLFFWVKE